MLDDPVTYFGLAQLDVTCVVQNALFHDQRAHVLLEVSIAL